MNNSFRHGHILAATNTMPRLGAKQKVVQSQVSKEHPAKLLVQPEDGVTAIIQGLDRAKQSIDILIFRFDHREVEQGLLRAVGRGVRVRALIAYTNRGGEKHLRALEMRLLAAGITVARSADDLARYHAKLIIIDERQLFVLAFNFTYLDIEHSRSFGVILDDRKLVREAMKLFEADLLRQSFVPGTPALLVSPLNARKELAAFLGGAKKQLLIYDPKVADKQIMKMLEERAKAGLDVKIIGSIAARSSNLKVTPLTSMRLHTRTIIRDGSQAFVGSQSLRQPELDLRREIAQHCQVIIEALAD